MQFFPFLNFCRFSCPPPPEIAKHLRNIRNLHKWLEIIVLLSYIILQVCVCVSDKDLFLEASLQTGNQGRSPSASPSFQPSDTGPEHCGEVPQGSSFPIPQFAGGPGPVMLHDHAPSRRTSSITHLGKLKRINLPAVQLGPRWLWLEPSG